MSVELTYNSTGGGEVEILRESRSFAEQACYVYSLVGSINIVVQQ